MIFGGIPKKVSATDCPVTISQKAAIEAGGSTLRDFHGADGASGWFALQTSVYDREGEPCPICGTPIRRIVLGQRSTYFCPKCQKK